MKKVASNTLRKYTGTSIGIFVIFLTILIAVITPGLFNAPLPVLAGEDGDTTGGSATKISLESPFNCDDISSCFADLFELVIKIATPIAVLMIMYGAFLVMTSREDANQRKKGLHAIWWAILGFAIILLASGIMGILEEITE